MFVEGMNIRDAADQLMTGESWFVVTKIVGLIVTVFSVLFGIVKGTITASSMGWKVTKWTGGKTGDLFGWMFKGRPMGKVANELLLALEDPFPDWNENKLTLTTGEVVFLFKSKDGQELTQASVGDVSCLKALEDSGRELNRIQTKARKVIADYKERERIASVDLTAEAVRTARMKFGEPIDNSRFTLDFNVPNKP